MDPKTRGIIAYITIIGWVIALIKNDPKDSVASFHIRQALGANLLLIAVSFISWIPIVGWLAFLGAFALGLMGFIHAIQGEKKLIPVLGEHFQEWFKTL